jgi:hypothetical protein
MAPSRFRDRSSARVASGMTCHAHFAALREEYLDRANTTTSFALIEIPRFA